jgi:intron-binding protein aquarius
LEPENVEMDNFVDTFLDFDHVKECFPDVKETKMSTAASVTTSSSPFFKLEIHRTPLTPSAPELVTYHFDVDRISVEAVSPKPRGPYPENVIQKNTVRFTSQQVAAIRSGMRNGLSLIVGPPGTGKTDVTVQLISNLYHNYPNQRILVVTHSNSALNDIFEKIMKKDIHPRHLLRLGGGESDLRENLMNSKAANTGSFEVPYSKQGRVDWCLMKRLQLLAQVQRLSLSLELLADNGASCETAHYFYEFTILAKMNKFYEQQKVKNYQFVHDLFPFKSFFNDVPNLFTDDNEKDLVTIESCFEYVKNLFEELEDYRPLEYFRTPTLRNDYILMNQVIFLFFHSCNCRFLCFVYNLMILQ